MNPAGGVQQCAEHDHVVQFYDSDEFLVASVREFLVRGLSAGEAAVLIATKAHRDSLAAALTTSGIDVGAMEADGAYVALDAAETLSKFMVDGSPDPHRFTDVIGRVLDGLTAEGRSIRAFGEMVALLWADGNVAAAIRLEELWNELAETHSFALFCAYPMEGFGDDASDQGFRDICDRHSHVVPAETYSHLGTDGDRLRSVAWLQQRATATAAEAETLKARQLELEETLRRLEEQDRLRTQFVAMVVHDLRTPTAVVSGFLQLLQENWSSLDDEQIAALLEKAQSNTSNIVKLIDDILTVTKLETGEFTFDTQQVDLAEIVYRAVGDIRHVTKGATFAVRLQDGLPAAIADDRRQSQILNNLLSNAVKFSPSGTTVAVTVRPRDGELLVSVRDEGVGISAPDLEKLFKRFSRLRQEGVRDVKGSGLGLYITKALVEGQGGRIWVESTPGRGSTFFYTVPTAA
ncbi:MAG: MEDS domain-containing protein [Actinobacteria bacterium]|nr:MEDS domain-containing protein [Actinomycetota bacterium]